MTSESLPGTARLLGSVMLAALCVSSTAGAQTAKPRPAKSHPAAAPAAAAPVAGGSIKYFCYSTDPKQRVVYFTDLFEIPDAGSDADNFIAFQIAKEDFQIYLIDTYKYPDVEGLVDCTYLNPAGTTTSAAATIAAKKKSLVVRTIAAKKQVVETGWKNKQPPKDDDDPIGAGGFITPPTH